MLHLALIKKVVNQMSINLKVFLILVCILFITYIYLKVLRKKLDYKSAFSWISIIFILVLLCLFDKILIPIKNFLGFEVTSNMIFFLGFIFLSVLVLSLSAKVNKQNEKIVKLTQELAILKRDNNHEKNNR